MKRTVSPLMIGMLALLLMASVLPAQVKGRVVLSALPKLDLQPHSVKNGRSICGPTVANESLLYGEKLGLQNVLLVFANVQPEKLPNDYVSLNIEQCRYQPHVLTAVTGDTLVIKNKDPMIQHARGRLYPFREGWSSVVTLDIIEKQGESIFNEAYPNKDISSKITLDRAGLLEISSETENDWMRAYVFVLPHRGFALTDEKGEFEHPALQRGEYDLILWHETLGVKRQLLDAHGEKAKELEIVWEIESDSAADSSAVEENLSQLDSPELAPDASQPPQEGEQP